MSEISTLQVRAFPSSLNELSEIEQVTRETIHQKSNLIQAIQQEIRELQGFPEIIRAIRSTPQAADPGKYGPAVFFFTKDQKPAFVQEFRENETPTRRPTIPLAEALTAKCNCCFEQHPLLAWYCQTQDTPDGDEWTRKLFVLCPMKDGFKRVELGSQVSAYRFM